MSNDDNRRNRGSSLNAGLLGIIIGAAISLLLVFFSKKENRDMSKDKFHELKNKSFDKIEELRNKAQMTKNEGKEKLDKVKEDLKEEA